MLVFLGRYTRMSWIEDFAKFQEMEEDLDLFQASIQGVIFWERVRFQVHAAVGRRELGKSKSEAGAKTGRSKLKRLISSVFKFRKNPLFSRKSDILFVCTSRRLRETDGHYWDIYTDPIIRELEPKPIALESHFENKHYTPARTERLQYLDFIEFLTYFKRKLRLSKIRFNAEESQILKRIQEEIQKRFDFHLDMITLVTRILEEREARLPLYRRMIKRIKPKIVVFSQSYGWEDLIEACRSLGVNTAELQHGIINPFHAGYSFKSANKTKKNYPDYVLTWGDYWNTVTELPIPPRKCYQCGFPILQHKEGHILKYTKKESDTFHIPVYNRGEIVEIRG